MATKEARIQSLINSLKKGNAMVLPTDTVLGLLSLSEETIINIKKRDSHKKTVRFIYEIDQIGSEIPSDLRKLLEKYWPGPLTVIYNKIGYRIPKSNVLLTILKELKTPLYASSANISGQEVANNIEEAKQIFKDSQIQIEYEETDEVKNNIASTVFNYDTKEILREGTITSQEIFTLVKSNE